MDRTPTIRLITFTYYSANGLFTLAASIIWGVNTLFLMSAGLDIFQVMIVNAAFTIGQLVFEVPTGVVADTLGRKTSFVLSTITLVLSTLMYVGAERFDWGIGWFIVASVLIGLGYTFQTGAIDAWLVDALDHLGYDKPMDTVFARGGAVFGVAMLIGTLAGGFLGQLDLAVPYYVRAGILTVCLVYALFIMRDLGFESRPFKWRRFGTETRTILDAAVHYGWQHRIVRPLFFSALAQGVFFIFGFYSWQRYFLDLLAQELVWVAGVVTALFSLSGILGNGIASRLRRAEGGANAGRVLLVTAAVQSALAIAVGAVGLLWPTSALGFWPFAIAVVFYLAFGVAMGIAQPVRQAFLNRQIPSAQRATVLSVDSFFTDVGASGGQLGLGWLSRAVSIPLAWVVGGVVISAAVPMYRLAGKADVAMQLENSAESGASAGTAGE